MKIRQFFEDNQDGTDIKSTGVIAIVQGIKLTSLRCLTVKITKHIRADRIMDDLKIRLEIQSLRLLLRTRRLLSHSLVFFGFSLFIWLKVEGARINAKAHAGWLVW